MKVYEVWKVCKGVMIEKVIEFNDYNLAWEWILKRSDSGSYVLRYFK